LKQWLREHRPVIEWPTLEGDDVCGILATEPYKGKRTVASIDKDLANIPGTLFNPRTEATHQITEESARIWHLMQTLTGDPTDGYKGCPGIGEIKAAKLLGEHGLSWSAVVYAYESKGLTEADALVQARVARILRHTDYNRDTGEVTLWCPRSDL
jgi:DNA polymerase-1